MKKTFILILLVVLVNMAGYSQQVKKLNENNLITKDKNEPSVTVHPTVIKTAVDFGITPPLRDLAPAEGPMSEEEYNANKEIKELHERVLNASLKDRFYPYPSAPAPDPVWQNTMGEKTMDETRAPLLNFAGQASPYMPSDCNGAAGPNHYMQGVNSTYAIYNKSGVQVVAPTNFNTLFSGVTGSGSNDGDIIVMYDDQADRWFCAEFSIPDPGNDYMLIAVSTTNDPTGTWYKWSFDVDDLPDYMKFGVWRDGYYMADNNSVGNDVYVFERSVMLAGGASPQMVAFNNPNRPASGFHCIMPLDNDGTFATVGTPGQFITINDGAWGGSDQLWIYEADIDWVTPSNSTFARTQQIGVAAFDSNFGTDWENISQQGTTQQVDAIPQILMFRAQYRNFGGSQAIVCCHTVDVDGTDHAGIRWYELQNTGTTWSIRQQGTYGPDAHSRWMASIAMDANHNIGIGYSISSSTMYPGIRYSGQTAAENSLASGIFDVTEEIIQTGTQSQPTYDRWGDYSEISLDPANDITFWYTDEYYNSGKKTKIATFQFSLSKPYTNFKLNTPITLLQPATILTGDVATYVDLTIGSVDSWLWTFQSGTPNSVTTQNSGNITYNTPGLFDVTLQATNAQGDSILTKADYIRVIDPSSLFCDTMVQFYGNPSIYTSADGYVSGTNEYDCSAIAEKFDNYYPYNKVTGGRFFWAQATNGTSPDVTFVIWGDNGSGNPGSQLATKTVALSTIVSDYNTDGYSDVMFDTEVILPTGAFFIGFQIPGVAASGDTLAVVTNDDGNGPDNTGYSLYSSWETYSAWGMSMMNAIFPFGCYDPVIPPVADFVGVPTTIWEGNFVTFTDQSYGSTSTSWDWTFNGGTPSSYSGLTPPIITYNTAGLYTVELTVSNTNGSDTETKVSYITVNDPSASVCDTIRWPWIYSSIMYVYGTPSSAVAGNNVDGDKAKADYFLPDEFSPYQKLDGALFLFADALDGGATTNITFACWDGSSGTPGTQLGTKVIPYSTIVTDVGNSDYTYVQFDTPIDITVPYFLGVILPQSNGDTLALYTTAIDENMPNTGWSQASDNSWSGYNTLFGVSLTHQIHPIMCTDPTALPITDFTGSPLLLGPTETVEFTNLSIGATSYSWEFFGGTPSSSTDVSPIVQYNNIGVYPVKLTSSNVAGTDVEIKNAYVNVTVCQTVQVDITTDNYGGETTWDIVNDADPGTILFSGGPYDANTNYIETFCLEEGCYTWTIYDAYGDGICCAYGTGSFSVDNLTDPQNYGTGGTFTTEDNVSFCITLPLAPPVASFYSSTMNGCLGSSIDFFDASANIPISWSWTFNGGTPSTSTDENPTGIVYNTAGTYDVSLYVTNPQGNDNVTYTDYITIADPPSINMSGTNETFAGACDGTATATPSGNSPFTYLWDVTVPGTAIFNGVAGGYNESATTYFNNTVSGLNTTQLDGTDFAVSRVCMDISQDRAQDLDLYLLSPDNTSVELSTDNGGTNDNYANVCFDMSAATPIEGVLTALSGDYRPSQPLTNFHNNQNPNGLWRLRVTEDSPTGNGGNMVNTWSITFKTLDGLTSQTITSLCNGTYNVTVTDVYGCTNTDQITLPVATAPVADFSASSTSICVGSPVNFTDLSTNNPTSWSWTFTGGTPGTSTLQNPTGIVFNTVGVYTISLTATNGFGNDTETKTNYITVNALPIAAITPATATICAGSSVTLTASGGGGATPYNWSTGATTATITVSPAITTTYTVTVTNAAGCTATTSRIVTVNTLPTATITPATSTICVGASSTLTASGGSGATPYIWSTGATTAAITVSPATTTTYTVTV
ncbi:MAG: PKD domain-containing protein, partial [Bacteroidota bacterium]